VRRKSRRLITVSLAIATTGGIAVDAVALHCSAERTPTPRPARSTARVDPFAEIGFGIRGEPEWAAPTSGQLG